MWKVGAALATLLLLLLVLTTQFWPHKTEAHPLSRAAVRTSDAQPLSRAAVSACSRNVVDDWVRDSRVRSGYPRQCYQAALNLVSGGDTSCDLLYGVGALCADLEARLRTSG